MRSMIGIDKLLFSLSINIAINSNIRETEYKMIIVLFFIIKLSVDYIPIDLVLKVSIILFSLVIFSHSNCCALF